MQPENARGCGQGEMPMPMAVRAGHALTHSVAVRIVRVVHQGSGRQPDRSRHHKQRPTPSPGRARRPAALRQFRRAYLRLPTVPGAMANHKMQGRSAGRDMVLVQMLQQVIDQRWRSTADADTRTGRPPPHIGSAPATTWLAAGTGSPHPPVWWHRQGPDVFRRPWSGSPKCHCEASAPWPNSSRIGQSGR